MPSYVIKRAPDVDEYLVYSTVVDHPTSYVLTRDEILDWHDVDESRVRRADENGSSALFDIRPGVIGYGWVDDRFMMHGGNCADVPGDWVLMSRDEMFEYMKADLARDVKVAEEDG